MCASEVAFGPFGIWVKLVVCGCPRNGKGAANHPTASLKQSLSAPGRCECRRISS